METAKLMKNFIPQTKAIMVPKVDRLPMLEAIDETIDDYKALREGYMIQ